MEDAVCGTSGLGDSELRGTEDLAWRRLRDGLKPWLQGGAGARGEVDWGGRGDGEDGAGERGEGEDGSAHCGGCGCDDDVD